MATSSIVSTLGSGSGIDITALVTSLVEAQTKVKTDALTTRSDKLTAQISAVSQLKSGLSGFSTALSALVNGGTLAAQATSSDTGIVTAKALPGAHLSSATTTLKVHALAAAQVASSNNYYADGAATVGKGTMTFTLGTATVANGSISGFAPGSGTPVTVTIDDTNNTLQGIADAINAANTGVTASIVTDSSGARLALKGATGAASAFRVAVTEDGAAGLGALAVGVGASGTTIAQTAADASIDVDGVNVKRATNSIGDLIVGTQIDLQSVNSGRTVTIGATPATAAMSQAVNDFVTTFNALKSVLTAALDPATGSLRGDPSAQAMARSLAALVTTQLVPAGTTGAPRTLAELGVGTNRDGTLTVNATTLSSVLAKYPATVEKMLSSGAGASDNGLSAALKAISDSVTNSVTGLGASVTRYPEQQSKLSEEQEKAVNAAENMRERLTKQFASMDSRVAAYKNTQAFLKNQIAAWNSDD